MPKGGQIRIWLFLAVSYTMNTNYKKGNKRYINPTILLPNAYIVINTAIGKRITTRRFGVEFCSGDTFILLGTKYMGDLFLLVKARAEDYST